MKRLLLAAFILFTGTAHAEVPQPAPLDEMVRNRFTRAVQVDEVVALKLLPVIEDRAREVRAEWVESYEGWRDRQSPELAGSTTTWGTGFGPYAIPTYIVMCESGGNYDAENAVSTASGAYQIIDGTWNGFGGYFHASDAPPAVQDAKAALLWAGGAGASHWASCL